MIDRTKLTNHILTESLVASEAIVTTLVAALEAVEWSFHTLQDWTDAILEFRCPSCNGTQEQGHATENYPPDGVYPCQLAAALTAAKAN